MNQYRFGRRITLADYFAGAIVFTCNHRPPSNTMAILRHFFTRRFGRHSYRLRNPRYKSVARQTIFVSATPARNGPWLSVTAVTGSLPVCFTLSLLTVLRYIYYRKNCWKNLAHITKLSPKPRTTIPISIIESSKGLKASWYYICPVLVLLIIKPFQIVQLPGLSFQNGNLKPRKAQFSNFVTRQCFCR